MLLCVKLLHHMDLNPWCMQSIHQGQQENIVCIGSLLFSPFIFLWSGVLFLVVCGISKELQLQLKNHQQDSMLLVFWVWTLVCGFCSFLETCFFPGWVFGVAPWSLTAWGWVVTLQQGGVSSLPSLSQVSENFTPGSQMIFNGWIFTDESVS